MRKKKYTDDELRKAIEMGIYSYDMPRWVKQAIEKKRQDIDRNIPSPEEELDSFMRKSGATRAPGGQKLF